MNREGKCCLCGSNYGRYGHNPAPLGDTETERCCDDCNMMWVMAARLRQQIDPGTAPEQVVRRYLRHLFELNARR